VAWWPALFGALFGDVEDREPLFYGYLLPV
jgi:hypothetical protein